MQRRSRARPPSPSRRCQSPGRASSSPEERESSDPQRRAGAALLAGHDVRRGAGADEPAARVAALGAEVDHPVGGADHVEVVLDDDDRVPLGDQAPERREQHGDVREVQAGRRLVEEQEPPRAALLLPRPGEVPRELQALRLAAAERRDRLAEPQVAEPDALERLEDRGDLGPPREERRRLGHGHREDVRDRGRAAELHLEDLRAVARPVAVGAAQVDVGEELHLHVLEAGAAARRAAPRAGVEAEGARRVAALLRQRLGGEQGADAVEGADVAGGVRARGLADRRLVDEDDLAERLVAAQPRVPPRFLDGEAARRLEAAVEHVLDQRRLAGAADAGDADEAVEGDPHVDAPEVVLGGAEDLQGGRIPRASNHPGPRASNPPRSPFARGGHANPHPPSWKGGQGGLWPGPSAPKPPRSPFAGGGRHGPSSSPFRKGGPRGIGELPPASGRPAAFPSR